MGRILKKLSRMLADPFNTMKVNGDQHLECLAQECIIKFDGLMFSMKIFHTMKENGDQDFQCLKTELHVQNLLT